MKHELDYYQMWNADLQLPRFDRVIVSGPGVRKIYEGQELLRIYDGGAVRFNVRLPSRYSGKAVRIVTERHELVSTPGSYDLVMPELAGKLEHSGDPTVRLAITEIPDDIEADVTTYYEPHGFTKPDVKTNTWTFAGILLPGQGLNILFRTRSPGVIAAR